MLEARKAASGVERDIDLPLSEFQALVRDFKALVQSERGKAFPDEPLEQLWGAIAAVFESWNTRRAIDYRKLHDIPDSMGTAVNIVAMVFGNMGEDSGTGVAFSRNPSTGERALYGEYLLNAQGEDVVSGVRTPEAIARLQETLPDAYAELERTARTLERHFRDMQDMEFTIERGKLYMLQTRRGQRAGHAAVRIACEMVDEGLITKEEAIARVPPNDLNQLLHPDHRPGEPARPAGARPARLARRGERRGRLRSRSRRGAGRGGRSRHPGAPRDVARGFPRDGGGQGGADGARRDDVARGGGGPGHGQAVRGGRAGARGGRERRRVRSMARVVKQGDGSRWTAAPARCTPARAALIAAELDGDFTALHAAGPTSSATSASGSTPIRRPTRTAAAISAPRASGSAAPSTCSSRATASTPMREMIVARDDGAAASAPWPSCSRCSAVTSRASSAPWRASRSPSAFSTRRCTSSCRTDPAEIESLGREMKLEAAELQRIVDGLREANPMLGLRGCRLGIIYPEITAMQARAIFEAACTVAERKGRVHAGGDVPLTAA